MDKPTIEEYAEGFALEEIESKYGDETVWAEVQDEYLDTLTSMLNDAQFVRRYYRDYP